MPATRNRTRGFNAAPVTTETPDLRALLYEMQRLREEQTRMRENQTRLEEENATLLRRFIEEPRNVPQQLSPSNSRAAEDVASEKTIARNVHLAREPDGICGTNCGAGAETFLRETRLDGIRFQIKA